MSFDHLLVIGFGGPEKPEQVKPFLEMVTKGLRIPEERLAEVARHYEAIGGASPYNEYTFRLFHKLEAQLHENGITLPLFIGMRNWHPFMKDTIAEIKKRGLKRGLGIILAPHRSDASFEKYIRTVEEAKEAAGAPHVEYEYLKPWHDHPLFIEAQADQVRRTLEEVSEEERQKIPMVFSVHSIPVEMAEKSGYVEEVQVSSSLVAKELNHTKWQLAYQSRSGNPRQPWLEPDVCSVIRDLNSNGERTVLLVPIGFLCENAEVLFDLDIEAADETRKMGMRYLRASTVMDHPKFVELFAQLIQATVASCTVS